MFSVVAIRALLGSLPNTLKVAIGAVVVVAVLQVRHHFEVAGLHKQIAAAEQSAKLEKAAKAEIVAALVEVTANRDALTARINEQNRAIDALRAQGRQLETAATLRAVRVLDDGQAASRDIRAGRTLTAPGHEGMNTWFRERFAH